MILNKQGISYPQKETYELNTNDSDSSKYSCALFKEIDYKFTSYETKLKTGSIYFTSIFYVEILKIDYFSF
ncbi:hypothetical protein [Labilibaculum antarcticum]|uniref:hypothetical protein n=1 Tax=Labilibaculum antarcticum TaxID=1717717 RepID=UPI000BBADF90|nr:hypothetical protein [Labilibaculum antarcticum]